MISSVPKLVNLAEFRENLPRRVYPFISNEETFQELNEFIKSAQLPKILVLYNSVGDQRKVGIGKKTVVSEFCHNHKARNHVNIRWLDAVSLEIFRHQLDSFAVEINIFEASNPFKMEALFAKLESLKWKTLLVIKNLPNWETLGEFLTCLDRSEKIKVIVISRLNLKRHSNSAIKFVEFKSSPRRAECEDYLKFHLRSKVKSTQLIQLLDLLSENYQNLINPMELEKLVSYLKFNFLYTPDNVINQLIKAQNFRITQILEMVKKTDPQAFDILTFSTYLHADFIPIELLINAMSKKKFEIQNSVKLLLELDFAELTEEQNQYGLKIHPQILNEVKSSTDSKLKIETKLIGTLNELFPNANSFYYPSIVSFLLNSKTLVHKAGTDKKFSQLCFFVGEYNFNNLRFDAAAKFLQMGCFQRLAKNTNRDVMDKLGVSYFRIGNFLKARECFESDCESESSGPRPVFTIGRCYFINRDFSKAVEFFKKTYDTKPSGVILINCLNYLALSYQELNNYSSAAEYNIKLLRLIKSNPTIYKKTIFMEIFIRLGVLNHKLGELSKSLVYYEKAYEIVTKTNDFRRISWLLIQMGRINLKMENFDQSMADFRTAHEFRSSKPDFSLLDQAEPIDLIGVSYRRSGNLNLAQTYFEKAFRLRFRHHGNVYNSDVANSYVNLGLVYRDLNQIDRSEDFLVIAYDIKKKLLKSESEQNLLTKIEALSKEAVQESFSSLAKFGDNDGRQLSRAFLFGQIDLDLIQEFVGKQLTKQETLDFIESFKKISF